MKRLKFILLALALPLFAIAQNPEATADAVLLSFLSKIDNQTLSADFTITVSDDATAPISYNGKLQMHGEKFRISMLGNEGAYDGKTYYLYSEENNELTLSIPTRAELLEVNPVLFARELQRGSTVRFSQTNKDSKRYVIELVPNNRDTEIRKFVIKLKKVTLTPEEITVNEVAGPTTIVRFSNTQYSGRVPSFAITPQPGTFINDMR